MIHLVFGEFSAINRLIATEGGGKSKGGILFQSGCFVPEVKAPASSSDLGKGQCRERSPRGHDTVYLTFPCSGQPRADWVEAGAGAIVRRCPVSVQDSIVGHGRRRKQAHDEHHPGRVLSPKLRDPPRNDSARF